MSDPMSALSSAISGADLSSKVSTRVARLALDQAQSQGRQMVELIRAAAPAKPAPAPGADAGGTRIDVTA